MKDKLFEIWLSLCCGPANADFQFLLDTFGTPFDLFNADPAQVEALSISSTVKQELLARSLHQSDIIQTYCRKNGIGILSWFDEAYPVSLRSLRDPPSLLYYRGHLPDFNHRLCIGVVGTRKMSEYGKHIAYKIGYELACAGAVVVSGMALGNDSVATAAAIAGGGSTVGVLGCGVDVIYPPEHTELYKRIMEGGVVMSEYPPGTPPVANQFPVRNRIISGLCAGTIVVEAGARSGALITAKKAIAQGRDIYAVPGNIGEENATGTNQLISAGATMILSARDVLENYTFLYRDVIHMDRLHKAEQLSELDNRVLTEFGVYSRIPNSERPVQEPEPKGMSSAPKKNQNFSRVPDKVSGTDDTAPPTKAKRPPVKSKKDTLPKPETPSPSTPARGDASQRILASLTDIQRGIFEALPLDHAVPVDYLTREGYGMSDIMATLTILEIRGLIVTLPGGLYARK